MKRIHGPNGSFTGTDQKALLGVVDEFHDERVRQAVDLGWTPEHDDTHDMDTMVALVDDRLRLVKNDLATWPSDQRVSEARDNLVKAGALLAAAITRLDREVSAS